MNIVPSNFLAPFLESDTLQIIFLAVIVGIAIGKIGDHAQILQDLFASLNSLFLAITSMISKVIPLAIFCMICIYGLLILIIGRLNPLAFYRKDWEGMLTSFTLSSSNAAMPTNMRICSEKLGISNKICSFSIPLGATVNMDGASIFLVTMGLGLARAYGVTVPTSTIFSLVNNFRNIPAHLIYVHVLKITINLRNLFTMPYIYDTVLL